MLMRVFARLLIFVCFSALAVHAQTFTRKNIEVSLSEGLSKYSTTNFEIGPPQSSSSIPERMRFDTGNRHEARVNVITTEHFGLEGFYMHQSTNVVFERRTSTSDSLTIPLGIDHFGASVLYYPLGTKEAKKWWPFVQVGGGAMIFRPTGEGQKIATDPLQGNLSTYCPAVKAAMP